MIYSLRMETPSKVVPNSKGKLTLKTGQLDENGEPVAIKTAITEIPSVTYAFGNATTEEYLRGPVEGGPCPYEVYVRQAMKKFPHSLHVVHFNCDSQIVHALMNSDCRWLMEVAVVLHVRVDDSEVANAEIRESTLYELGRLKAERTNNVADRQPLLYYIDKIMIHDNSRSMWTVQAERFKKQLKMFFENPQLNVGICGSPLSRGEDSCLSARQDREWAAIYVTNPVVALPSANHQNMERCGCIRDYIIRGFDVITPEAGSGKKSSGGAKKPKAPKVPCVATIKRSPKAVKHP